MLYLGGTILFKDAKQSMLSDDQCVSVSLLDSSQVTSHRPSNTGEGFKTKYVLELFTIRTH